MQFRDEEDFFNSFLYVRMFFEKGETSMLKEIAVPLTIKDKERLITLAEQHKISTSIITEQIIMIMILGKSGMIRGWKKQEKIEKALSRMVVIIDEGLAAKLCISKEAELAYVFHQGLRILEKIWRNKLKT